MDYLVTNFAALLFYALAALTVAGAVGVVALKNPVHSALALLWTFMMVAALFILRHAEFLAAVQVLVYAGGILVLFLFVIMMVNVHHMRPGSVFLSRLAPFAVLAGVLLGALIAIGIVAGAQLMGHADTETLRTVEHLDGGSEVVGNTEAVGMQLYRTYLVPFEVVSVVLLVAMIGAIVFGRKEPKLDRQGGEVQP